MHVFRVVVVITFYVMDFGITWRQPYCPSFPNTGNHIIITVSLVDNLLLLFDSGPVLIPWLFFTIVSIQLSLHRFLRSNWCILIQQAFFKQCQYKTMYCDLLNMKNALSICRVQGESSECYRNSYDESGIAVLDSCIWFRYRT